MVWATYKLTKLVMLMFFLFIDNDINNQVSILIVLQHGFFATGIKALNTIKMWIHEPSSKYTFVDFV